MNWKIRYGDGSTFSDLDGSAFDAPGLGVVTINVVDPEVGFRVARSADYYCYDPEQFTGGWEGVDIFGLWDYLSQPGPRKVVFGRTYQNSVWDEAWQAAKHDPDMPLKSARFPTEGEPPND